MRAEDRDNADPQGSRAQAKPAAGSELGLGRVESPTRRAIRRFFRHKLARFGLVMLSIMVIIAIAAPLVAPYSFRTQDLEHPRAAPSAAHWLGTDSFGRDVLSRLIYGARVSLSVGLIAVGIYETIAILLGAISGYYGGKIDWIIMRVVDMVMTFPTLMIILFLVALLGPSIFNVMIAIGIVGWTGPTRLIRGQILQIRELDYILAARSIGVQNARMILRHILPGAIAPLVVHATFGVAGAILTEAGLSFLGLGILPPAASWGNMMSEAQELVILKRMPWLWAPPGVAIMLAVLSINFIGDGLRDALDPRFMNRS